MNKIDGIKEFLLSSLLKAMKSALLSQQSRQIIIIENTYECSEFRKSQGINQPVSLKNTKRFCLDIHFIFSPKSYGTTNK